MDPLIREVQNSEAIAASPNVNANSNITARTTTRLTHRQRQVEELYDWYDFLMLDSLLKRHPTPEEHTGSWFSPPPDCLPPLGIRGFSFHRR